jgi:hypothetical protein
MDQTYHLARNRLLAKKPTNQTLVVTINTWAGSLVQLPRVAISIEGCWRVNYGDMPMLPMSTAAMEMPIGIAWSRLAMVVQRLPHGQQRNVIHQNGDRYCSNSAVKEHGALHPRCYG